MSYLDANRTGDRVKAGIAVAVIVAGIGYAALTARLAPVARALQQSMATFDVDPPKPPPPPPPPPEPRPKPKPKSKPEDAKAGEAAPKNLRAKPTQIVAPPPRYTPPIPLPITAAPVAGEGNQSSAGASDQAGPGTGAGGTGNGLGGVGSGDGTGSGGIASEPKRLRGNISDRDFRKLPARIKIDGTVTALITIGIDGRPTACRVTHPSGSPELDARTCALIRERFVYEPARDRDGRAIVGTIYRTQRYCLIARACVI